MAEINQHLYRIMKEAEVNDSPRWSARIPREMGVFELRRLGTAKGLSVTRWHMKYKEDIYVERKNAAGTDEIQFIYFLNRGLDWDIREKKTRVHMETGEACMYRNLELTTSAWYPGECEMMFDSLCISRETFSDILRSYYQEEEAGRLEKLCMALPVSVKMNPAMYRTLYEIQKSDRYRGGTRELYLESNMRELLSVSLFEFLEKYGKDNRRKQGLSRTQRETIQDIRERIDEQPWHPFTGEELAAQSGLSLSRFSRLFSEEVGTSPHAYIIEKRLEYAAALLTAGDVNVSQAAAMAGYSNMSHFSAAFRKKYGILPGEFGRG